MQVNINFHNGKYWNIETDPRSNHRTMHHFRLDAKEFTYFVQEESLRNNDSVVITTPRNQLFGHHDDKYIFLNTNEDIKFLRIKEADSAYAHAGPVLMNHEMLKFVKGTADWTQARNVPYWEHNTKPPKDFPNGWTSIGSWHTTDFNTWIKRYSGYTPLKELLTSDAVVWDTTKDFPLRLQISVLNKGDRGVRIAAHNLRKDDVNQSTMQVAYKKVGGKVRASSLSACFEDTGFNLDAFSISTEYPDDLEWIAHKSGAYLNFIINPKDLASITDVIELFMDAKNIHKVNVALEAFAKELNNLMADDKDDSMRAMKYRNTIEQGLKQWDEFKDLPKDKLTVVSLDGKVIMLDLIANNDQMFYNLSQAMARAVKDNEELFNTLSIPATAWVNSTVGYMFGDDGDGFGCDDDE